jgi:hypothetical protein
MLCWVYHPEPSCVTQSSVRNIPSVDEYYGARKCILTGETVDRRVVIAKAY